MSFTLDQFRADLRNHLGMDNIDLPQNSTTTVTGADSLLNRSYWNLVSLLKFNAAEEEYSLTTVINQREYDISVDEESIQRVIILDRNDEDNYSFLIKIDDWNMYPLRQDESIGTPTHYARRNDQLILHVKPDDEYTIRVKYLKTLDDIQTSGAGLPRQWDEVILMGAIERGFYLRGDLNRANHFHNVWANLVNTLPSDTEKEMEDVRYSGFKVIRPRYR